jgi:hypothetical protein
MIEPTSATAGKMPLYPPLNPAMKCGSINPSTTRRSASTYSRFMYTSRPSASCRRRGAFGVVGVVVDDAVVLVDVLPTISTSSSSVLARWEPVPLTMVTFSGGTWESSSKSQGRRRSRGRARVMSGITTANRSPEPTSSFRGAEPMGSRAASQKAAASSGRPSSGLGASTVTLEDGISTSRLPVPYCSCASILNDLPVPRTRPPGSLRQAHSIRAAAPGLGGRARLRQREGRADRL